jgi:Squalene-hopene cyclase C-terminal domain/Prenyltransferase and squalene oxidase repeat
VSWELASFLILGAVLVGGFAWYERSRPSSQVVALVAALAALAVAGRVAFAALPNVVATTDVVVFAGFALGPAPGFAVGALAGLVSNFWLGQGPWTPWQMAGWGLCGILGAVLGRVRPGANRFTLAAVCGLAGVGYGALLNFSLMATYGGDLSLQRFLALESRGLPFDAAHAIGNAALALIAGPAIVRMLVRFRERFEWRAPAVASLLMLALALATVLPARAEASPETSRAAVWLASVQNSDGGWGASPEDDSKPDITAWAMLGLEAAGRNPLDVSQSGRTGVDYLRSKAGELNSAGDFARTILALDGAGANPRAFGGRNLVEALAKRRRSDGSFEGWPGSTAFAIIALRASGATGGLGSSTSWLAKAENGDGGWGDTPGSPSTADGTGATMQAIPGSDAARRGLAYLRKAQRSGGGFPLGGSGDVNSQSTAWAVQGIIAVGTDPATVKAGGKSAPEYLSSLQQADGHYSYSASSDQSPVWVTGQVLAATAGKAFPITPVPRQAQSAPSPAPQGATPGPGSSLPSAPSAPPSTAPGLPVSPGQGGAATPAPLPGGGGATVKPPRGTKKSTPAVPLPEGGTAPESKEPSATPPPAAPPFEASENSGPKPLAPLGIGLGSSGVALGGVLLLGRRFGW